MVNIPPIPPLLCSTPPPIDFGENDDVDVLPPSLDCRENEFDDFLTEEDTKIIEPLPSPRPPSVCDLPPFSIYDGLTNNIVETSPPPEYKEIRQDSKNHTKSINLTEAFNYNVRNTSDETASVESKTAEITQKITEQENVCKHLKTLETESSPACVTDKIVKDLTIESLNVATQCNSDKVVSIEDIEDDLSDDELYSPKTPKNFGETDNLNDYFKIEEIKTHTSGNETKFDSMDAGSESFDILDNNESASLENGNDNDFKSFTSNNFTQNRFDVPPPLQGDANSIDEDDDFGDFADFQETQFVNNPVPVNDSKIQQHNNDLELNDFNKFKTIKDYTNKNTENKHKFETDHFNPLRDSEGLNNEISLTNDITCDEYELKDEDIFKQTSLNLENISQEISNDKNEPSSTTENKIHEGYENFLSINKSNESMEDLINKENTFGDLNAVINDDDEFGNFSEFSSSFASSVCKNTNGKTSENLKEPIKNFNKITNVEFDNFADFESHQEVTKSNEKDSCNVNEHIDDEDDDFGDFNTAEPITTTASTNILNRTSQNKTSETPTLPQKNLNERISKILQLMFTPPINPIAETSSEPKTNKIKDIPFTSIDAAKALEYQWLISDTRHSFIRSLGIDSKNILFGDNWNPSLPRFAANLSFNPLKPMKPIQTSSGTGDSSSMLEPIPFNSLETMPCTTKIETLDLNCKSFNVAERTIEDFKDNTTTTAVSSTRTTSMPYMSKEPPPAKPVSLTIFENSYDNEDDKSSKTPPISEMESITTFTSPLPADMMDMELPPTSQIVKNMDDFDLKEVEENFKNTLNINEVVVTSTFTGSFKETHIYTPPKTNDVDAKHGISTASTTSSSPTKTSPIDFDYEKAAMGVIINETVVKKEYRDVEYNPPFTMETLTKSNTSKANANMLNSTDIKMSVNDVAEEQDEHESSDDFSEFQSVSSEVAVANVASVPKTSYPAEVPKNATVSHGGMILSPAILIPQAISMENQKPKIEWGDSTANINPEELARIEELFPEPRSLKSSNSSQKSTPTHHMSATPSISATVANKELEGNINNINDDDDDWSDFVSVTVTNNISTNRTGSNNNILGRSQNGSPFKQRSPQASHRMPPTTHSNSNYDDEWSEFVSSAPTSQQSNAYNRVPQFNSGAWQNANFYNNPLSMYHKGPLNIPKATTTTHSAQKPLYNNNNNNSIHQQPYQIGNNLPTAMLGINQTKPNNAYQQQVHVMQNFSTAPVPTPERISAAAASASKNSQFQSIGSAKVAPSIALIPDLGFVAPAIPTHTSFINSLPKPSINTKK